MYFIAELAWGEAMNRARERAIRTGLAIVENHRAVAAGLIPTAPSPAHDRSFRLDQARLNIVVRSRTSRLPWRGQFAPELIDYFMDTVCRDSRIPQYRSHIASRLPMILQMEIPLRQNFTCHTSQPR